MKKIHELMNEVSTGAITNEEYTNEYRQIHLVAMQGDMDTVNDLIAFRKESVERSKQKQERVNNKKKKSLSSWMLMILSASSEFQKQMFIICSEQMVFLQ